MEASPAHPAAAFLAPLKAEIARVLVGQEALVDRMLVCLLTRNHLLVEGLPGLAKTLAINTLANCLDAQFGRIQFTPDLLPGDVVGSSVYNPQQQAFIARPGPVFTNLLLADEINRAPAKVQSALLEAMQERQVTLDGETRQLPSPFLVMATQNPIEQEGTYALPEAQLDRFMMKVKVGYPSREEERRVLRMVAGDIALPQVSPVATLAQIADAIPIIPSIHIDERLENYLLDLVTATRGETANLPAEDADTLARLIRVGASPRATIMLAQAGRARAFLDGRDYVLPDDIKAIAPDVLRHRVLPTYEAQAEDIDADAIIQRLLSSVPTP